MPKLHELLAVRDQHKGQAEKTRQDLATTFEKKRHLFEETLATYTPLTEGATERTEAVTVLQTTVADELRWISKIWAAAIDVALRVEDANTGSRADIKLDNGSTFLANVPGLALLELERRIREIQTLVESVPTLDPAKAFAPDPTRKAGTYKAREVTKTRTEKVAEPVVLIPPTKEHPGQAQLVSRDKPIGTIRVQEWSGMVSPATKAAMLERCEEMGRAIKAARSRAGEVDVSSELKIGAALLAYVFEPAQAGEV